MEELHVNLPIFLWAISWNVEELVSHPKGRFARTTLMISEELLTYWHQLPRQHNTGIQTKAAKQSMADWALAMLCDTVDDELSALGPTMHFPQDDLAEEALLDIRVKKMIPEVQTNAPMLWKFVSHLICTQKQVRQNKNKTNPELVAYHNLRHVSTL
jgi:hypothetical protein